MSLPDPTALPEEGVLPEPPLPSTEDMERTFRRAAAGFLVIVGSFCLWFALSAKVEADAEHAVTATWSPVASQLYQELPAPAEVEGGEVALRGPLLPIRLDRHHEGARVDTRVFLALPAELCPRDPRQRPAMALVLRYEDIEMRSYGMSAKGGNLTRRRQGCQVLLYDLEAGGVLVARQALQSPDPLPAAHGDPARLVVQPEQILAALRALSQG